jgi:hypothetical protein
MQRAYMEGAIRLSIESVASGEGPFRSHRVKGDSVLSEGTNLVTLANDPTAQGKSWHCARHAKVWPILN